MSEQDVLKPQFTLEQIREAKFKLLSEVVVEKSALILLAAMAADDKKGLETVGELSIIGAICTLYPDLKTGIMDALPRHPAVTRQVERILGAYESSFNHAASELLAQKTKA